MTKIFETTDISKIQDEYRTSEKFDNFRAIVENKMNELELINIILNTND